MIECNRKELLSQLDIISPGLAPRDIVEQSSCVVFKDGHIMTFNDEIACRMKTNLKLEGAIQAATLIETLRKMTEDIIRVDVQENQIVVHGKRRQIGIGREATILLPIDTLEEPGEWHPLPDQFSDAVDMVLPCCGKDEQKTALTCVHMFRKGIDASDNYQYGHYRMKMPVREDVLVRAFSMKHVVPMGVNEIALSPSWAHFKNSRGLVISCRRCSEDWQNYESFLEQEGTAAKFPKALAKAAELAAGISGQNADNNQVTITIKNSKLKIQADGVGCWSKEWKKVLYEGDDVTFRIDPTLLQRICNSHNNIEINDRVIIVRGNRFTYVTCLGEATEAKS
jgi:hypothetical protein